MKANETPEKLYIDFRDRAESTWRCAYTEKVLANDIEYTSTDAFIAKAWEWVENNILSSNQQDKSLLYYEQFINYMKGE